MERSESPLRRRGGRGRRETRVKQCFKKEERVSKCENATEEFERRFRKAPELRESC